MRQRIAELHYVIAERVRERLLVSKETAIRETARLAFSDIGEVAEWDTFSLRIKNSMELPLDVRAAVKKVKFTKEGVEVVMHDKVAPLKMLNEHLGVLKAPEDTSTLRILIVDSLEDVEKSMPPMPLRTQRQLTPPPGGRDVGTGLPDEPVG